MTAGTPTPGAPATIIRLGARLDPVRSVLTNGVTLTVKTTRKTPAVSLNVSMSVGSANDPDDAPGTAFLVARVIDRGTATRSADEIADLLESRGITLSVAVTRHQFSVLVTCLSEDFEIVLGLIAEILRSPAMPETELATRKGEVITAIRQDEDSPAVRAVEGLLALLYADGHPYGRRTKGSVESVDAMNRAALMAFHDQHFGPERLSVVVAGDVEATQARDAADRAFEGWSKRPRIDRAIPEPRMATTRLEAVVPMPAKAQSDVAYGFTAIRRADPAYYAYWLMNNALGQYALGGRLGSSIREKQGMAYSVGSALDANLGAGPLIVRAGVAPENVERAIASIDAEMRALLETGLTAQELQESRQYLIGSMPRALETNSGIATFLQNAEFFDLGLDYDARMPDLLGAVTLDDVHAAARRTIDPDRAAIVIAGPREP